MKNHGLNAGSMRVPFVGCIVDYFARAAQFTSVEYRQTYFELRLGLVYVRLTAALVSTVHGKLFGASSVR